MKNNLPPKSKEYFEKGMAAKDSGRFKSALNWFIKAAELSKGKRRGMQWVMAGSCEEELGNLAEALRLFRKAERCAPRHALIQGYIGIVQQDLGRPKLAVRAFRKSIDIEPSPEAYTLLGLSLERLGRPAEKKKCCRAALRLDPDYEEAHYNLAVSYKSEGQLVKAERHFRRAIEIDSKYAMAYAELGNLLRKKGEYREARRILRRSVRLDPNYFWSRIYLGVVNYLLRRLKETEENYREAVRIDPNDFFANTTLGSFLSNEQRGDPEPFLTRGVSLAPNDTYALFAMGKYLYYEYRDEEAARYLKKAARKGDPHAKQLLTKFMKENG